MASMLGGAGFHADGKLPRFRAVDFHAASELGPIADSTLADWPLTYDELVRFIEERMSMSHIYQPVVIRALVEAGLVGNGLRQRRLRRRSRPRRLLVVRRCPMPA